MKVLVDYSTHCSTTRSSFSFDLKSCSVSLRGILLAEYKILYGINVASQAADDHVQCVLQRTLVHHKHCDSLGHIYHFLLVLCSKYCTLLSSTTSDIMPLSLCM